MTSKEIEKYRKKLVGILKKKDVAGAKEALLKDLARELGATGKGKPDGGHNAGEPELVDNIHYALQTASMVDMCRTAGRNYWIAFVAALIAFLSAAAAWAAVYVNILAKMSMTLYL